MLIRLETPHFIVRTLQKADVTQDFAQWFNAPELLQGLKLPRPQLSLDRLHALVARFGQAPHFLIALTPTHSAKVLGIYHLHLLSQHRTAILTFGADTRLETECELQQESCAPLCDYFFQQGLVDKISVHILSNNPKQLHAFEKCGRFVTEATLKREILTQDSTRLDITVLSCFKAASLHAEHKPSFS